MGNVRQQLGFSRIRLYQMLRILTLPQPILDFIRSHGCPAHRAVFTEHRLRPLAQMDAEDKQMAAFGEIVATIPVQR